MAGKDNPAVLEAVKRAQEIANRITGVAGVAEEPRKRPADSDSESSMPKKAIPGLTGVPTGGQIGLGLSGNSGGSMDPKALAQSALAKIGIPPIMGQQSITLEIKIPDSLVGLVIGRGGDNIQRMQGEAGAKIQVAPDGSAVNGERGVTITGSPDKVEYAKQMVLDVVAKNKEEIHPDSINQLDANNSEIMMVLATRVGLIIGKGGEMIKSLSERSGCKLQMIQDGQWLTAPEKPLKITGERDNRMRARQLVSDLIASKEGGQMGGSYGGGNGGGGGGGGGGGPSVGGMSEEYIVPAPKCGVIIGKGGETIRQLMAQTGAHIELSRAPPPVPDQRVFIIKGTPAQIETAKNVMSAKLDMQQQYPQRMNPGPNMGFQMQQQQQQANPMFGNMGGGQQMYGGGQQGYGFAMQQAGQQPGQQPGQWGGQPQAGQQQPGQQPGQQPTQQPGQQMAMGQPGQPQQPAAAVTSDYSAAWAAYYQNLYSQQQQGQATQPQASGQAGQPSAQDVQAQWAEYYRQMGYPYPYGQGQPGGGDSKPGASES